MRHLRPALVLIVLFTVLTGLALPLGFSGAATALLPGSANGSMVERDGKIVGSMLIGQNFTAEKYFHGRPSATTDTDPADSTKTVPAPYNANNSGGSNLAPTSKALLDRVKGDAGTGKNIPADAMTTSASGLDPHISPANAQGQIARVAAARAIPEAKVRELVDAHVEGRFLGLIGEPRVNVLALNMALDATAAR